MFYLLGGGWCTGRTTDAVAMDCLDRSEGLLGSTKGWDDTLTWIEKSFSGNSSKDLTYYNWNRVWVIYCDGSGHQGHIEEPLKLQDKEIYFRGQANFMASLDWTLARLPANETDRFTLYGYSAGGLAALSWLERVQSILFT